VLVGLVVARTASTGLTQVLLCQATTCVPAASWATTGPTTDMPQEGPVSLQTHFIKEFNVTGLALNEGWLEEGGLSAWVEGEVQGPGPFIIRRSSEEKSGGRVVLTGEERGRYGDLLDTYTLLEEEKL